MTMTWSRDIGFLEDLAATYRARLRVLERQIAVYGIAAPAHIILDKEEAERDLACVLAELRWLQPSGAGDRVPYQGLRTFQERDADLFFGREALVAELLARVERAAFLAVLGASGSGKSSVVRAGLLPELRGGALLGSQNWRYAIFKPGDRPLDALAAALAKLQGVDLGGALDLSRRLAENERALLLAADLLRDGQDDSRLVLVIDQAEELWTLAPADPEARTAFIEQQQRPFIRLLLAAAAGHSSTSAPVLVILTMRADFLHRAAEHTDLARLIGDHDVIVSPMIPNELHRAIVRPAEALGCAFEPGLAEELVRQAQGRPGALPLLEYTLLELWKARRSDGTLTWQAFKDLGGVEGALAARADAILTERYTPEQRERLRHLLLRLVQPGEGAADTRRRALLADLAPAGEPVEQVQALLQPLVDERLLVVTTTDDRPPTTGSRDKVTRRQGDKVIDSSEEIIESEPSMVGGQSSVVGGQSSVVEVAHEALIRAWPALGQWIGEARADLGFQIRLEEAAKEWQASAENSDFLWDGLRLANAEAWLERARPQLNTRERRFLDISREAERADKEAQEATRREREALLEARAAADRRNAVRLRWFLGVVSVLLVVAIGVTIIAVDRQRRADEQARLTRAGQASTLAAQSQSVREEFPQRALLLALEALYITRAVNEPHIPAAEQALREALSYIGGQGLHGHMRGINAVAFSPDGRWMLTGSDDKTARLWDTQATDPSVSAIVLRGHAGGITAVAFSPDGRWALTGSQDNTAQLWDTQATDPSAGTIVLRGHKFGVTALAFSPDGRWVLTGSQDTTARLWDTQAADPSASARVLRGHQTTVGVVAFSPDGRWVLTGSQDTTARLWDTQAADPSASARVLRGHAGGITAVAFSRDGRWVVTASADKTAWLWDTQATDPSASAVVLRGHAGGITAVAFSPDGRWILTGSNDDTARLWDMRTAHPSVGATVLRGHEFGVTALAFSPDGRWVLTGSDDNTARLWDTWAADPSTSASVLRGHEGGITAVAFSRDGRRVVTGSRDTTARLWDPQAPGSSDIVLRGHRHRVDEAVFSPDGRWVLTSSGDKTARLWDTQVADPSADPTVLRGHEGGVVAVAFSPDGRWVLTGSDDNTARLWDTQAADPSAGATVLRGHDAGITEVAFSPDGRWMLTGSDDNTARLWDIQAGPSTSAIVLRGHDAGITEVAFSPDGRWVLTASADATARLWDMRAADPSGSATVLHGHESYITAVAFSPDGRWVLTGSMDYTARLWDTQAADPSTSAIELSGHEGYISVVAFNPDGRWMLTGSEDTTARLWDTQVTGSFPIVLRGHEDGITEGAFSPDGRWVLTSSDDATARLWDIQAADPSAGAIVLRGHEGGIREVAFSPDGRWVLTGSEDTTARLWQVQLDDLLTLACRTAVYNLTWNQWQQYFPGKEYRATCPNLPDHSILSAHLVQQGAGLVKQGKFLEALALYKEVQERDPGYVFDIDIWDALCWYGSLSGQAKDVLEACEQVVKLAPDNGYMRDSRGLARALSGDTAGAIEDFKAFITWGQGRDVYAQRIAQRKAWVAELEAGRNPFDTATLGRLWKE